MSYILAIDQGTTSSRAIIYDKQAKVIQTEQKEHKQIYPQPGFVEHNALEIWNNVEEIASKVVKKVGWKNIEAIGITNQRETVVAWDSSNGKILANAIVWQCRRTTDIVEQLVKEERKELFHKKTGLILDAYFSGTKMKWLIENNEKVKLALKDKTLRFGTIDSFLINKMSGKHITDVTNASRTLLYNLQDKKWDQELLEILNIPEWTLPDVVPSSYKEPNGRFWIRDNKEIPILGIAGDQQSALFGQNCYDIGDTKVTYGTGNFSLTNIGSDIRISSQGLLTTAAWAIDEIQNTQYALEGAVFVTGALVQWLRDELQIIVKSSEIEQLALESKDSGNLVVVPAFVGLGAPYWNQRARGTIIGLTRGTNRNDIAKASLESIALQTFEIVNLLGEEGKTSIKNVRVDGGACKNNYLMQLQANILQKSIERPKNVETTALGAAFLAGLGAGVWNSLEDLKRIHQIDKKFNPDQNYPYEKKIKYWKKAVQRSLDWE
jgi:glycerol kinase